MAHPASCLAIATSLCRWMFRLSQIGAYRWVKVGHCSDCAGSTGVDSGFCWNYAS